MSGTRPPPLPALPRFREDDPAIIEATRDGLALLDEGFPWEAHERFEALWHAAGRAGDEALAFQAMAKVCAARVKAMQGNAIGFETHRAHAAAILDELMGRVGERYAGLALVACRARVDVMLGP